MSQGHCGSADQAGTNAGPVDAPAMVDFPLSMWPRKQMLSLGSAIVAVTVATSPGSPLQSCYPVGPSHLAGLGHGGSGGTLRGVSRGVAGTKPE